MLKKFILRFGVEIVAGDGTFSMLLSKISGLNTEFETEADIQNFKLPKIMFLGSCFEMFNLKFQNRNNLGAILIVTKMNNPRTMI